MRATRTVVAVLEVDPTGHRLRYVRHLHDAVGADQAMVLVPSSVPAAEEYGAHLAGAGARTALLASDDPAAALAEAVERASALGVHRLVIPDGDRYVVALLRLLARRPRLPVEIRLLLMRSSTVGGPEPLRPAMLVKPVAVALLRHVPGVHVHVLTDAWGVDASRRGYPGVPVARDPVPSPPAPRESPGWIPPAADGRVRVGLFGVISPRKNLPLLVAAAVADPGLVVVVGGTVWPEVATYLDADPDAGRLSAEGRLVVAGRLLADTELAAALRAVDVVAVLHDNDAPSGILAQACQATTPSVVASGAWLERVVTVTGIGRPTAPEPAAVAAAVRAAHAERAEHVAAATRARAVLGTEHFTSTLLGAS